jgi:hypothetical protein
MAFFSAGWTNYSKGISKMGKKMVKECCMKSTQKNNKQKL